MLTLLSHPPDFTPGMRYTEERKEEMKINEDGFLTNKEEKLVHHLVKQQEMAFAWNEEEKGRFSEEYFDPVTIPTIKHVPWVCQNIPIPPSNYQKVVNIIKSKIAAGVYKPSNSSYQLRWFCVLKKDRKSLRLVHDLQPLNAVTVKDAGLPPMVKQYAELFGGRGRYGVFDLLVGFDQRSLAPESRNLTTFQSPVGTLHLASIPMGYTNPMQIQQADLTHIMQPEIPHLTMPFVDNVPVKGPATRYKTEDGFETIPENPNIRRFVWEHLNNVNQILQHLKHTRGTFSAMKSHFCVPSAVIVGHRCTYKGHLPDTARVQKIVDWPIPKSVTEVRGFLGTLSTIRIFIKDFAAISWPLVNLTKKDIEFEFGKEEEEAMKVLKALASNSPAIRALDYPSDNKVILAIGYILQQLGNDNKRYPSQLAPSPSTNKNHTIHK
jgi:hypothetical protein